MTSDPDAFERLMHEIDLDLVAVQTEHIVRHGDMWPEREDVEKALTGIPLESPLGSMYAGLRLVDADINQQWVDAAEDKERVHQQRADIQYRRFLLSEMIRRIIVDPVDPYDHEACVLRTQEEILELIRSHGLQEPQKDFCFVLSAAETFRDHRAWEERY